MHKKLILLFGSEQIKIPATFMLFLKSLQENLLKIFMQCLKNKAGGTVIDNDIVKIVLEKESLPMNILKYLEDLTIKDYAELYVLIDKKNEELFKKQLKQINYNLDNCFFI